MVLETMKQWWVLRTTREQAWLRIGGTFSLIVFLYVGMFLPYWQARKALQMQLSHQVALLQWMQTTREHLQALQVQGQGRQTLSNDRLFTAVDQDLNHQGMQYYHPLLKQVSQQTLAVEFAAVGFDDFISWLQHLNQHYRLQIKRLTAKRVVGESGMVKASVLLSNGNHAVE